MNSRIGRLALLAIVGLALGGGLALYGVKGKESPVAALAPAGGAAIGGAFSLVDQNGRAVTEKDYANSYKIVFFGFTNCPDICPAGLQKIAAAMETLGDKAEKIQPLFITVDPARDTPETMKDYVAMFDPRIAGLSGTEEQVKAAQASYKVYAARAEDPAASGGYTMNHSAYIFFMSPDGDLLGLFSGEDSAEDMAKAILSQPGF